jgi:hypothetical protein
MQRSRTENMHQNGNNLTESAPPNNSLTQVLLSPSENLEYVSADDLAGDSVSEAAVEDHPEEQPKASFANSWIKPGLASYIVATGMNIAVPHFFGQTIGRIPVVGDWTINALKTVFTKTPVPVLDMLMTAGNMGTYNGVKGFFSQVDESGVSIGMKITNGVIFFGTAALVGYTTRLAFSTSGHTPEEGMIIPVSAIITPEQASFIPEPILQTLYLWNQNISALTIAAQTIVAPVVNRGLQAAADKAVTYAKQRFFPIPSPQAASVVADLEHGSSPSSPKI